MELLCSGDIIPNQLSVAHKAILIGYQTLQSNGSPCMKLSGADANLRAKAIAETIRKTGGAVAVHARGIHQLKEALCRLIILRENAVRMMGTKTIDMSHGLINVLY